MQLIETVYDLTLQDALLAPLFTPMPPQHRENVALWFAEVFGGPKRYSEERGSHRTMILKHQQFSINEAQRRRWTELMVDAADAVGLPSNSGPLGVYSLRRVGDADGAHVHAARCRSAGRAAHAHQGMGEKRRPIFLQRRMPSVGAWGVS